METFRTGFGYDIHKLVAPTHQDEAFITLCGIKIKHYKKLLAHSDGDVALHAVTDAILGALGDGDIGDHFPDTDQQWKDKPSKHFVHFANEKASERGYTISNVDVTIVCEKPKIYSYKTKMQENLATLLKISKEQVNIKATTNEGLGHIGSENGIASYAAVLLMYKET